MTNNATHLEIEMKFEAFPGLIVPEDIAAGLVLQEKDSFKLSATYFDTQDAALAQHGVAVRRRTGGHDAGWHVKRRIDANTQEEKCFPLSDEFPAELLADIAECLPAGHELEPMAEINTIRTAYFFANSAGEQVIELADDEVVAVSHVTGQTRVWREWETEFVPDYECSDAERDELFGVIGAALRAAGGRPSLANSKIGRAVGALVDVAVAKGKPADVVRALELQDVADCIAGATVDAGKPEQIGAQILRLRNMAFAIAEGV